MSRLARLLTWLLIAVLGVATAWIVFDRRAETVGGPFRLVAGDGRTLTERDFLGHPYGMFFGYTHCPDVCPTTLSEFQAIEQRLGAGIKDFTLVFVTVDPDRDTPAILKDYLASFSDRVVGLSGSSEAVAAAIKAFKVYAKRVEGSDGDYSMDHTATMFLFDRSGRYAGKLLYQTPEDEAVARIKALIDTP